ncbi:MAG: BspA family leucine-rich repeat surface protein, partial [Fibrobacterales bacterium]
MRFNVTTIIGLLLFFHSWSFAGEPMVLVFNTELGEGTKITLPLSGYNLDVTVDWGDGSISNVNKDYSWGCPHWYSVEGTYTVKITGEMNRYGKSNHYGENREKLVKVVSFGEIDRLNSLSYAFQGAVNLEEVPAYLPEAINDLSRSFQGIQNESITNLELWDVSNVRDFSGMFTFATHFNEDISDWKFDNALYLGSMFWGAESFNQDIGLWNVGTVKYIRNMFKGATSFNQDIGDWKLDSITDMSSMFSGASSFNQDISGWNVDSITDMSSMFSGASSFNQDIGGWNVDSITDMSGMFSGASSFNQDISGWVVGSVTDMSSMFSGASSFNQDISGWVVGNITDMSTMFSKASSFNQDISGWVVDNVTDMSSMFSGASSFNQDIGGWNVDSITDMNYMFSGASSFNQDIGGWNVDSVTNMKFMFYRASSFNQNISEWNVENVTNMFAMFANATSFNQSLGSWNVSNVSDFGSVLSSSGLTVQNYNDILVKWSALDLVDGLSFNLYNIGYSSGDAAIARQAIIDNNSWTIYDAGVTDQALIQTGALHTITEYSAVIEGEVIHLGGTNPTQHGMCWGASPQPIITDDNTEEGVVSATGTFSSTLSGLAPNTTYYVRAYITNGSGTSYGGQVTFSTLPGPMVLRFNTTLSSGTTIALPFGGLVNVAVDWGDGSGRELFTTNGEKTHTYSSEGEYVVRIYGALTQFGTGTPYAHADKLVNVSHFGDIGLTSLSGAFYGAIHLDDVPETLPSTVTDMSNMFNGAMSFDQDIGHWDVSNVTDMSGMMSNVTLSVSNYNSLLMAWGKINLADNVTFNGGNSTYSIGIVDSVRQSIIDNKSWSITDGGMATLSLVTTEVPTAFLSTSVRFNGSISHIGTQHPTQHGFCWSTSEMPIITDNNIELGAVSETGDFSYDISNLVSGTTYYVRTYVINAQGVLYGEQVSFSPLSGPMILEYNTNLSTGTVVSLYFHGVVDVTVDWGDGKSDAYTYSGFKKHVYTTEGEYSVSISGNLQNLGRGWMYGEEILSAEKLVMVTSFGDIGLIGLHGAFAYTKNLKEVPSVLPSSITDLSYLFESSKVENVTGLCDWDVSGVTNMASMFNDAKSFNQDIGSWKVDNVTDMSRMFSEAESFDQDIGSWNVDNVTDMNSMFSGVGSFNQDIGNWKVDSVTDMNGMFRNAESFNQDIRSWNVDSVTDMSSMFSGAESFNQDIGSWNVDNVTDMRYMFGWAESYNQDIGGWNVESVKDMACMFCYAELFNQDIGSWKVDNVTDMSSMFSGTELFNQDIGSWSVDNVTDMSRMFGNVKSFNQDIGSWNVDNVTDMSSMFYGADIFNQDIGSWNVDNVTDMEYMFGNAKSFNQDIGSWNVDNVTDMSSMFYGADIFNQDIGSWNVDNVTDMEYMFNGAEFFNQDVSSWNVSKVTNMNYMFGGDLFSTKNYNALLIKWSLLDLVDGVHLGAGYRKYSPGVAASARQKIITDHGWRIDDFGEKDADFYFNNLVWSRTVKNNYMEIEFFDLKTGIVDDYDRPLSFSVHTNRNIAIATIRQSDSVVVINTQTGLLGLDTITISATNGYRTVTETTLIRVIEWEDESSSSESSSSESSSSESSSSSISSSESS